MNSRALIGALAILASILSPSIAAAKLFTVGNGPTCTDSDLQTAISKANDLDEIHIAATALGGQHLHIHDRLMSIIGGYASCSDTVPTQTFTLVSGNDQDSILLIDGSSNVTLEHLNFANNTLSDAGSHGGAINYTGHGSLTLDTVSVAFNTAGYGGGINMSPDDSTDLYIRGNVLVIGNTALREGGGINLDPKTQMYMLEAGSSLYDNAALGTDSGWGFGGGLQINENAIAEIGAAPTMVFGTIDSNSARYGGGVAVRHHGILRLYSTDVLHPLTITGNSASHTGGGIYVAHDYSTVCGFSYRIDGNTAANGAAIYADASGGGNAGQVTLDGDPAEFGCTPVFAHIPVCASNQTCNSISNNTSTQPDSAIIIQQDDAYAQFRQVELRGNVGWHILQAYSPNSNPLRSALVANNTLHGSVFDLHGVFANPGVRLQGVTIAGNILDSDVPIITSTSSLYIADSILFQPSHVVVRDSNGGSVSGQNIVANEIQSLSGLTNVTAVADPGFIHAPVDYHLKTTSVAVDKAKGDADSKGLDLDGNQRGVVLTAGGNSTPYDLGAYERTRATVSATFPSVENFDELDLNGLELPPPWISTVVGAGAGWFVTTDADVSVASAHPLAVHADDIGAAGESDLTSSSFTLQSNSVLLSFKHKFQFEPTYDGAILEISFDNGPFMEIIDAGGRFVKGGYDAIMQLGATPNPIDRVGRLAWSSDQGAKPYSSVGIVLPPNANHSARLRWRVGSDGNVGRAGYSLDTLRLFNDDIFTDSLGQ